MENGSTLHLIKAGFAFTKMSQCILKCGIIGFNKLAWCFTILCLIITFYLLVFVLVQQPFQYTVVKNNFTNYSHEELNLYWNDSHNIDISLPITLNTCNLTVSDIHSTEIDSKISQRIHTNIECKKKEMKLKLQNIKYLSQTLGRQWLHADVKISDLIFVSNYSLSINPFSFSGFQFRQLKSLILQNVSVTENTVTLPVSDHTVTGLSPPVSFIGLFRNFNKTLTKLSIARMHGVSIKEIVGNVVLPSLQALNLEHSKLKDDSITKFDFVNTRNITWLRFFDCKLQLIGADAFYFIRRTIKEIDIRHNRLLRLPEGLFDSMLNKRYELYIHLAENPWMCGCTDLSISFDRAACLTRANCGIESVTNPYGLAPRNHRNKETMDVECVDYEDSSIVETIQVECRDTPMTLFAIYTAGLRIDFESDLPNFVLLWFNDSIFRSPEEHVMTASDITCITPLEKTIYIDNLYADLTYTFCLMENTSITMSPFNCIAYYFPPTRDMSISMWFSIKRIAVDGLIALGIFILFICIGVMIGIWFVRRRNLIRLRKERNLIMSDSKNSVADTNSTGFTSDCGHGTMGVEDYRGYLEQRRHSDTSIKSFKGYEVALNPSRFDIVKSRLEKTQYENKYYSEHMPKQAPPEPPSKYHNNLCIAQKFDNNARPKITRCIDDFNLDGLYAKCGGTFTK